MFLFRIYLIFMSQKCKAINCLVIREVILTYDKIGDFSLIATNCFQGTAAQPVSDSHALLTSGRATRF